MVKQGRGHLMSTEFQVGKVMSLTAHQKVAKIVIIYIYISVLILENSFVILVQDS